NYELDDSIRGRHVVAVAKIQFTTRIVIRLSESRSYRRKPDRKGGCDIGHPRSRSGFCHGPMIRLQAKTRPSGRVRYWAPSLTLGFLPWVDDKKRSEDHRLRPKSEADAETRPSGRVRYWAPSLTLGFLPWVDNQKLDLKERAIKS